MPHAECTRHRRVVRVYFLGAITAASGRGPRDSVTARAALQIVGGQGFQGAEHPGVELMERLELRLDRLRLPFGLPHGVDDQARYLALDAFHTHPLMTRSKNVTYLEG